MADPSLIDDFRALVDALEQQALDYAACGGIAVNVHGHVRATTDIDLLIRAEDRERVLEAVRALGFKFVAGPIPFESGTPRERVLYRASRIEGAELLTVDLLLVTPVFAEIWAEREVFEWENRRVTVVSLSGLTRMKRLAGRHQDLADLENLGVESDPSGGKDA